MELKSIIEKLNKQRKGTYVSIGWKSNIESAKARKNGISVVKETSATVRWGINYSALQKVISNKESQCNVENNFKPWYRHSEENPYILEKLSDTSKTYIQLFTTQKKNSTKTKFFVNGKELSKEELINLGYVNPSEFNRSSSECLVMNIPTENVIFVGK